MLYKIIAKKENEHNQLVERIEKSNSLDFANVSFVDKMTLVKLKHELAQLHLIAASLAKKYGCLITTGKHLNKVIVYNPYVLVSLIKNTQYQKDILPKPDDYYLRRGMEDALVCGFLVLPSLVSLITIVPAGVALDNLYQNSIDRVIHASYVSVNCEANISKDLTAQECFHIAVYYINSDDNYLAIRYLLEADIRATETIVEIEHYFELCLFNLLCKTKERNIVSHLVTYMSVFTFMFYFKPEALHITHINAANIILGNINKIIEKVKATNPLPQRDLITTLWTPSYINVGILTGKPHGRNHYSRKITGGLQLHDDNYHWTIPEIINQLRRIFFDMKTWEGKPYWDWESAPDSDDSIYVTNNQLSDTLSLIELLAYMTQIMKVPESYISKALSRWSNFDYIRKDPGEYLEKLIDPKADNQSTSVEQSEDKFNLNVGEEYQELLALLIFEKNFTDCKFLQTASPGKFWNCLHNVLSSSIDITVLPSYLRNPLIYIKNYLNANYPPGDSRVKYLDELIYNDDLDINTQLTELHIFDVSNPFKTKSKEFFTLMTSLSLLKLDYIEKLIIDYKNIHPICPLMQDDMRITTWRK